MINIAIDGPSGAGKSTIARKLAASLGYIYVDTGALYRAIGYHMLGMGVDTSDVVAVEAAMADIGGQDITIAYVEGEQRVMCMGEDVSDNIRTPEVSMAASAVSAVPAVRAALLDLQKSMARHNNVVMDGRDIGTVVLPNAQVKIFLTASPEERARRRYNELMEKGQQVQYENVLRDVKQRDYNDENREIAPLKPAADSVVINTTGNTLEKSVTVLTKAVIKRLRKQPFTLYRFFKMFLGWLLWLLFPVKVHGKDNIPLGGGLIVCANHTTMLDPLVMALGFRRQVFYMAKIEIFKVFGVGAFIRALGAFPVDRGAGGQDWLLKASDMIKSGCAVGIYPEGTRSKDLMPGKAKAGTAIIAHATGADVLPIAICCKKGAPRIFRRTHIFVGPVIPNPHLGLDGLTGSGMSDSRRLRAAANLIMEDIRTQWEKGNELIGRE